MQAELALERHAREPIAEKNPRLPTFHRCGSNGAHTHKVLLRRGKNREG